MKIHRFDPQEICTAGWQSLQAATPQAGAARAPASLACVALLAAALAAPGSAAGATSPAGSDQRAGATQPAAAQGTSRMKAYRGLRASQVIGMSVRNPQGNNLGQISDMIVNLDTGDVHYALLKFDPGIFEGEKLYAVPTTELRMAPDRDDMVYNMSRERLERAGFDRNELDRRWRDRGFFTNLDRVWGRTLPPTTSARAYRASALIGKDVKSRNGEDIGEIEELVIDMANQRVHYAVMEFDPGWTTAGRNYVFPLRSFELGANREDLVLAVDKSLLRSMKNFDADRYGRLSEPAWVADVDRALINTRPMARTSAAGNDRREANAGDRDSVSARTTGGDYRGGVGSYAGTGADRGMGSDAGLQARAPRSDRN